MLELLPKSGKKAVTCNMVVPKTDNSRYLRIGKIRLKHVYRIQCWGSVLTKERKWKRELLCRKMTDLLFSNC